MSTRPEYTRPFSREYQQASGHPVTRVFDGPFREYVDSGYVEFLETELARARENAGGTHGTLTSQT